MGSLIAILFMSLIAGPNLDPKEADRALALSNEQLMIEVTERRAVEAQARELFGQLVNAEEEERRRVARELHDSLGQHVVALTLGLTAIAQDYRRVLKSSRDVAEVVIETARPLNASDRDQLVRKVVPADRARIVSVAVRPELIGGVRVIVDDVEHDFSLAGALENVKQQLVS